MGRLIPPLDGLVYVDTNSVVYRVERVEPYWTASAPLWEAFDNEMCRMVTSELTWFEVLVKPMRDRDRELIALFREILFGSKMVCRPIDLAILETAAFLRASQGLKTPDSIHAATAIRAGATMLLTNDAGFRNVPGLDVIILDDVISS